MEGWVSPEHWSPEGLRACGHTYMRGCLEAAVPLLPAGTLHSAGAHRIIAYMNAGRRNARMWQCSGFLVILHGNLGHSGPWGSSSRLLSFQKENQDSKQLT